jgi:hypothetical protein
VHPKVIEEVQDAHGVLRISRCFRNSILPRRERTYRLPVRIAFALDLDDAGMTQHSVRERCGERTRERQLAHFIDSEQARPHNRSSHILVEAL